MKQKNINILAIESSCDETAAAVFSTQNGLESSIIFSQLEYEFKPHRKYRISRKKTY